MITEAWVHENLYCVACDEDSLLRTPHGRAVVDFRCDNCRQKYQLKARGSPIGHRIPDAAWKPMSAAVRAGKAPSLLLLQYDPRQWKVKNLFGVPNHFLTLSSLERRKPLGPSARRAGWVGCNILLRNLPVDGKVYIVHEREEIPHDKVRRTWRRFEFMKKASHESRGWTANVLACVRRLNQRIFTLEDVYVFEGELARLHPRNRHVKAKIRQQLQVLRDQKILRFLDRGNYLIVD